MIEELALFDLDDGRGSQEQGDHHAPKKHEPLNLGIKTAPLFAFVFLPFHKNLINIGHRFSQKNTENYFLSLSNIFRLTSGLGPNLSNSPISISVAFK